MTKTKSTKRSLLMSALALLVCVSMFIGSTFAWFTDSVSSTNNIIQSGNLDVELEYYDGDSWEKVTATTNVFEENTLWEPGHTEVVYLKVSNLGTLALKYNLGINIVSEIESINVAGEALRLSNYIEFGAIEGVEKPYADRAAARAAVTDAAILSTGYTKAGSIEAGAAEQYVALVVYMPETVGNDANYRTGEVAPQINLGINLMATQYTSEKDSFDELYDEGAKFGGVPTARVTVLSEMPTVTTLSGNTVTLDTGYVFNATETYEQAQMNAHRYWHADFVATFDKDVDDAAIGLAGQYDAYSENWLAFELNGIGDIAANTPVRMLINEDIGTNVPINYEELCGFVKEFSCGAFAVDPVAMAGITMTVDLRLYETTKDPNATSGSANEETGKYITIGTYSYTFGAVEVSGQTELNEAIANGATAVELSAGNYTVPSGMSGQDVTIVGSGDSTVIDLGSAPANVSGSSITFENLKIVGVNSNTMNGYGIQHTEGDIVYKNCTFENAYTSEFYGNVSYIDCTFTGTYYIATYSVKSATFENCVFDRTDSRALLVYSHGDNPVKVTVKNCEFKAAAKGQTWVPEWTAAVEVDTTNIPSAGTTVTIEGCTYDEYYNGIVRDKSTSGKETAVITVDGVVVDNTTIKTTGYAG